MLMRTTLRSRMRWSFPWSVPPAQGVNLLYYSQDFENPVWFKTLSAVSGVNTIIAPDASLSAEQLDFQATPSARISQSRSCALATHVFSVYAKAPAGTTQQFALTAKNDGNAATYSSLLLTATDTWQRFELQLPLTAAGIVTVDVANQPAYTSGTIHLWGAQLELGSTATAYVRTEG